MLSIPSRSPSSHRLLLLLTLLPLSLAAFAFILQWRGGGDLDDPTGRWPGDPSSRAAAFPGMENSSPSSNLVSSSSSEPVHPHSSDCVEILGGKSSPSFPYYRGWKFGFESDPKPKHFGWIGADSAMAVLSQSHWSRPVLSFCRGKAAKPEVSAILESIPGVKVIYRTKDLEEQQARSRIWNETWLAGFFYKPCNYELFVKQSLNMEMAIVIAQEAGMDWIIHLDTDELLHPAGAAEYSLRRLLADTPSDVDLVIFPNYESSIERDDIKDPFSEVSMFKKNYDHLPKDTYFALYKDATRDNPNYFLTYGNGKSAARIQDNLRPNGAHRWHNYMKSPNEIKLDEAAVLHFTYTKFSDLTSRRDRCGCKPTKEDVKRCFMLDFDRAAFIIASTATEEEMKRWYNEHVVWNDKQLNLKLLRRGVMTRIYAPMSIIQGLRESGVFASAIEAGQTRLKQKLASLQNGTISNISDNSRTVSQISQISSGRKILESSDFIKDGAIRPLSPPGFDQALKL